MHRITRAVAAAAIATSTLSLTGCGGDGGYEDLLELRDDAVDAGLSCDDWTRKDKQLGECDGTVLALYGSAAENEKEVDEHIDLMRGLGIGYTLLVGETWFINGPDAPDLQDDLDRALTAAGL